MSWLITPQTKVPIDPFRSQVSLLLHGDGADGSTTIIDSSPTPKTVTAVGNAQISTAQSKFSGSSLRFFGGHINTGIIDLQGDFTLECWARPSTVSDGAIHAFMGNFRDEQISITHINRKLRLTWAPQTASTAWLVSEDVLDVETWQHVAVSRSGTTFRLFCNGQIVASGSNSNPVPVSTGVFRVGATTMFAYAPSASFLGFLDEVRVTIGVARYVNNFTPPTEPFPDL